VVSIELLAGIAALSLISAAVAGLLGAGGDILYIPLLLYALPVLAGGLLNIHEIGALALVQSIASTGGGGAVHLIDRRVDRPTLWRAAPPLAVGALIGSVLSRFLASGVLLVMFGAITSAVVLLLLMPVRAQAPGGKAPSKPITFGLFGATALVCSMVGIGGGFLIVTILLYRLRMQMETAKGTALTLTVCTAVPGLVGKVITEQLVSWATVPVIIVAATSGGILGARFSTRLSATTLRLGLAVLVAVLSVRVWFGALGVG
jgi:uncharacterized membrane protein YfcA